MIDEINEDLDPALWFEKAATQILFAHALIEDDKLNICFQKLCIDRPECRDISKRPIPELFRKINAKLRSYSMEIKSVAVKVDGVVRYFHGIANTEVNAIFFLFKCDFELLQYLLAFYKSYFYRTI